MSRSLLLAACGLVIAIVSGRAQADLILWTGGYLRVQANTYGPTYPGGSYPSQWVQPTDKVLGTGPASTSNSAGAYNQYTVTWPGHSVLSGGTCYINLSVTAGAANVGGSASGSAFGSDQCSATAYASGSVHDSFTITDPVTGASTLSTSGPCQISVSIYPTQGGSGWSDVVGDESTGASKSHQGTFTLAPGTYSFSTSVDFRPAMSGQQYTSTNYSLTFAAAPEPAALGLLVLAAPAVLRRSGRGRA